MVSYHERNGAGRASRGCEWQGLEGVTRLTVSHGSSEGVTRLGPWSPMVSEQAGRASRGPVAVCHGVRS